MKSDPEPKHLVMDADNAECLDTISSRSSPLITVLPALRPLRWAGCVTAVRRRTGACLKSREEKTPGCPSPSVLLGRQCYEVSEKGWILGRLRDVTARSGDIGMRRGTQNWGATKRRGGRRSERAGCTALGMDLGNIMNGEVWSLRKMGCGENLDLSHPGLSWKLS